VILPEENFTELSYVDQRERHLFTYRDAALRIRPAYQTRRAVSKMINLKNQLVGIESIGQLPHSLV
jgi:hypothetical protein